MKCKNCFYLNYDPFSQTYEQNEYDFCGLHGRAHVDVESKFQMNLNSKGGCGFLQKNISIQLNLFEDYD